MSRAVPVARIRGRWPELEEEGRTRMVASRSPLEEVLRDPIVRALMRSDGVRPEEVPRRL